MLWEMFVDVDGAIIREAQAGERQAPYAIAGFDRQEEAVVAAAKNVAAADVADAVRIAQADAGKPLPIPTAPPGLLVSNPPYGNRLKAGGQQGMKTFYFHLGESFRRLDGWRMVILSGNPAFESAFHRRPTARRALWNGPIECQLLSYAPARAES